METVCIDGSQKVIKALSMLSMADSLKNATTKDGRPLWKAGEMPPRKDLETAASCFAAIKDAHITLPHDGSILKLAASAAVQAQATSDSIFEAIGEAVMDGFHSVKQKVEDAVDWIVHKAGTTYNQCHGKHLYEL